MAYSCREKYVGGIKKVYDWIKAHLSKNVQDDEAMITETWWKSCCHGHVRVEKGGNIRRVSSGRGSARHVFAVWYAQYDYEQLHLLNTFYSTTQTQYIVQLAHIVVNIIYVL